MSSTRKTALIAGALFVITFLTSIPAALLLYTPVLDHTNYIVGAGADTHVAFGALLEVLLIIANVGSAVVLFPILKRQNEALALGYVTARIIESRQRHPGPAGRGWEGPLAGERAGRQAPVRGQRGLDRDPRSNGLLECVQFLDPKNMLLADLAIAGQTLPEIVGAIEAIVAAL